MKIDFLEIIDFWDYADNTRMLKEDVSHNRLKRDFLLVGTVNSKMLVETGILGGLSECDTMLDIFGNPTRKNLAWIVLEVMLRKGIKIENRDGLTSEELDKILLAAKRITIHKGELSGEIFVSDEEYVAFGADESEEFLNEIRRLIKREESIKKVYNPVTKKWKEIKR